MTLILEPKDVIVLLSLGLAFIMTLLAIEAYHSYETTQKRLTNRDAELRLVQETAQEFRRQTSEAFADQKSLKLRIEALEGDLVLKDKQLYEERNQENQLRSELDKLRREYENTKMNLTEAFRRLREKEVQA